MFSPYILPSNAGKMPHPRSRLTAVTAAARPRAPWGPRVPAIAGWGPPEAADASRPGIPGMQGPSNGWIWGMGLYGWWMWMKIYLSIYLSMYVCMYVCVGLYHVISGCIVRSYSWLYDIWLYLVNLATSASRRFSIGLKASSWPIQNHPNGPATKAIAHANS